MHTQRHWRWRLCGVTLLLLGSVAVNAAPPLRVLVSVPPQQTWLTSIAGGRVTISTLIHPGQDPHTYDPTPRQVADLAGAVLYARIGVPFEDAWLARIRTANPNLEVLDLSVGLPRQFMAHHEYEHAHKTAPTDDTEALELDPHLWTSPLLAKQMGERLRDALIRLDPQGTTQYQTGYAAFAAELDRLDQDIRRTLAGVQQRRFLVFHPAWGYFAATYDLEQVPIERLGKEPSAKFLTRLIEQAQREHLRLVLTQPQFDSRTARTLARAIAGYVESVDDLGLDYFGDLRQLAQLIATAGQRSER